MPDEASGTRWSRERGRRHVVAALAALLALAPGARADQPERSTPPVLDDVVLQVPYVERFEYAGYVAALEKGFFRAAGLNVRFRVARPGESSVDAVLAGNAAYGTSSVELVYRRLHGDPVVVLAAIDQHSRNALAVRGDSGIDEPARLAGRRVEFDGGYGDADVVAMLRQAGVGPRQFTQVQGRHDPRDLAERKVDAMALPLTTAPYDLRRLGANPVLLRPSSYGIDFYGDALFTTEQELRDHPERVEAMRRAALLGWVYALRHPDEMIELLRSRYGAALGGVGRDRLLEEAALTRELMLPDVVDIGTIDPARYQRMAQTLVSLGLADTPALGDFVYEVPTPATAVEHDVARWVEIGALAVAIAFVFGGIVVLWNLRLREIVRRRTRELADSEAMYRLLAENDSDVTARHDPDGVYRYVSPAVRQVLGYEPEQLLGAKVFDLVHPDDLGGVLEASEQATDGAPVVATYRLRRADGSYVWVETAGRRVLGADGELLEMQTSTRDISARRAAEEELRDREAQLSSLARTMPAAMWAADGTGRLTVITPRWEELTGQPVADALANGWLEVIHEEDRPRVRDAWARMVADGTDIREEYRVLRPGGELRWLGDFGMAIRDADGAVTSIVGTSHDVTDARLAGDRLEARAAQQAVVATLGVRALATEGTVPELLHQAAATVRGTLRVDAVEVLALDDRTDALRRVAHAGEDVSRHGSVVGAEIRTWSGRYGELRAHSARPRPFSADDLNHLQAVANVLAGAIERDQAERELQHQAMHDALTGLPNRALLRDRLDHALGRASATGAAVAVLFLDLDHFKVINDSAGHAAGDELLLAVAGRLRTLLRPGDTAARFGGDEFVLLCEQLAGEPDAVAIAERVVDRLREPFVVNGDEVAVTASVGIALVLPGDPSDADAALRDADAALYRAKTLGRSRYELFDETMRGRAVERLQIESGLRRAVERGELDLHFQPIVGLTGGELRGFEALLRWRHPERGLLGPVEFVQVAEETNLIQPIGRWVLGEACRQAAAWNALRPDALPLKVAVNLSARQVAQADFPAVVAAALDEYGLTPGQLVLEITESVLIEDTGPSSATLAELARRGVALALDDFGTGYSSLGYLQRFPLDALKLDRSFVAGLGSDRGASAIVAAIVGMAQALGLDAVAEGVETPQQVAALRDLGCPYAQGFHFSRPVPAEAALELVRRQASWLERV